MTTATATTAATVVTRRSGKALLAPLATLVAATGIALASGATFSSSTASAGLVASGTLTQVNSNTIAFSKDNLKPGDVVTGEVTIRNSGTLAADFTLTESTVANTFAPATDVRLVITQDGAPISEATLGSAGALPLGVFAAGESRTYGYTVTFSADAANSQQGRAASTRYAFTSVQTAAETFAGTQSGVETTDPTPAP